MIFSVIISEKGGAERRESFDRTEINVGRVQGNDLMLPKGNVSKRHARLLFRDGRFIVNDLKSTNGTYVNGRKIAQATIVREGDKIYIGDFVLRIEAGPGAQLAPPQRSASGEYSGVIPDLVADGPPSQGPASVSQGKPRDGILTGEQNAVQEVVSHFPLENDPDEAPAAAVVAAIVPGPPRVPRPAQSTKPSGTMIAPTALPPLPPTTSAPPPLGTRNPSGSSIPAPPQSPFPGPVFGVKTAIPPAPVLDRVDRIASEPGTGNNGPSIAHRAALRALLERTTAALPVGALEAGTLPDQSLSTQITAELKERATAMQAAGQLPDGVTVDQLVGEARRELCELGPLGPLLADDDVVEIHVKDHERLLAYRRSRKQPTVELPFSSDAALARTLQRFARPATQEEPGITTTFRTADGVRVVAVSKGASERGHFVVLRKPQRAENATIEELVRSGLISRVVATLLQQCLAGRANVLVTGASGSGHGMLLAALAQTSTFEERIVALQDEDEIAPDVANMLSIPLPLSPTEGARVARAALQMRPDRLVIGALHGAVAAEVVLGMGEGSTSLLAGARAPTLRHALSRLTTQLVANRPGLDVGSARETLASSFDLVLEVARLRDGRARLVRLAELTMEGGALATRDIFTFTIERTAAAGAIEGSLHPTGTVPMFVEDLAVRGVTVDPTIFRRSPGR